MTPVANSSNSGEPRLISDGEDAGADFFDRDLLTDLPIAVYTCNAQGQISRYNRSAAVLWGTGTDIGEPLSIGALRIFRTDGTPLPSDESPTGMILRGLIDAADAEIVIERPNGSRTRALAKSRAMRGPEGRIAGAINVLIEIPGSATALDPGDGSQLDRDDQADAMARLHDLALVLAGEISLQPALQAILDATVAVANADFGVLSLIDPSTGLMSASASVGFDDPALAELRAYRPEPGVPGFGASLYAKAELWIEDTEIAPEYEPHLDHSRKAGYRAVFAVPILTRSREALGNLCVYFRRPGKPSKGTAQLIDLCARHAATTIQNVAAQTALRESEQRFRQLADQSPVLVWVTDTAGMCTFLSRSWYDFTGQTEETGLGIGWLDALHPDDVARTLEICDAAKSAQKELRVEYRLRRKDGEFRWIFDAASPRFSETGEFLGYIGSLIDVTEEKERDEAVRRNARIYRAIGESIDYGIWICDRDGRNTYASDALLHLLGITQEECTSFGWTQFLHSDDQEETIEAWKRAVATGQQFDKLHRLLGVDGKFHPVLARGVPVRDQAGEIVAWSGINLDVSRLKDVENELRDADRRKDEFLATLAHELRNPLAPIRSGLDVMWLSRNDPEVVEKMRAMMEGQVAQMTRLVDDLLDLSRITRDALQLRTLIVDLRDVIKSSLETAEPIVSENAHELIVDIPNEPVVVEADPVRLAQAISNLLNNAAKYTVPGGCIRLIVEPSGDQVVVTVRDNGIGIPEAMLESVFDMFSQVDHSDHRGSGGLGIGLTLVRRLIEMHGGTVTAESGGTGQGSDFVVRLPLSKSTLSGSEPPSESETRASRRAKILVVDDNRDAATVLGVMLESLGHDVRTVFDGAHAIELASSFEPEIVLLDIGMPGLDGYETASRMRKAPWGADAVLIALTGWGQNEDKRRSRDAGFDRHLVKPVDFDTLQKLCDESVATTV